MFRVPVGPTSGLSRCVCRWAAARPLAVGAACCRCVALLVFRAPPDFRAPPGLPAHSPFVPACCCLWPRGCSGRRRPRPPARSPHASLKARSGRSRSPPVPSGPSGALHTSGARSLMLLGALTRCLTRPCRRPPAPRPGPAGHAVASNRVGLGARVLVLAMLPPTGTAPVPLSAHHTGAASLLIPGSARQDRRLDRSSWAGPERNIAPADCSSAWHASAVKETSPQRIAPVPGMHPQ